MTGHLDAGLPHLFDAGAVRRLNDIRQHLCPGIFISFGTAASATSRTLHGLRHFFRTRNASGDVSQLCAERYSDRVRLADHVRIAQSHNPLLNRLAILRKHSPTKIAKFEVIQIHSGQL